MKYPETHPVPVEQNMYTSARTTAQTVEDVNKLRIHISRAEAAGAISPLFALRLRLMADQAESRLSAVDKVIPFPEKVVLHGAI